MKKFLRAGWLILAVSALPAIARPNPVIVHEWGTFTSLQDEHGEAIGGINVDDEPVPSFVFQDSGGQEVAAQYSQELRNFGLPPYSAGKGWAAGDPAVTMRLETPVIYFYPPKGQSPQSVPPLQAHVDFHGGFLTQFYPYAEAIPFNGQGEITKESVSSLDWDGVRIGSKEAPIQTEDKVWTTPREVAASVLEVAAHFKGGNGQVEPPQIQAEHFLFYRGVGHLDSPLQVHYGSGNGKLSAITNSPNSFESPIWSVEIKHDGSCAFRCVNVQGKTFQGMMLVPDLGSPFSSSDFNAGNLAKLQASMQSALVKAGLYPDEASAMLRTWALSYFKSPGLRLFYIAPRSWVEKVLPLKITGAPTQITRVMVGRIELISDAQREALADLASGPCPDLAAVKKAATNTLRSGKVPKEDVAAYYRGERPLTDLGIPIPLLAKEYLSLGRFRDALVLHSQHEHPSAALAQLIKDYWISPQAN